MTVEVFGDHGFPVAAEHGVGFAGAGLSVCEDGHVIALWYFGDEGHEFVEYLFLGGVFGEGVIEFGLEDGEGVVTDVDGFVLVDDGGVHRDRR